MIKLTQTDTQWTARLNAIMPDNFMSNINGEFLKQEGILDTMMEMIGKTVIHSVDNVMNPFTKYTKSIMDYGSTVQEYKSSFIAGEDFTANDPVNPNPYIPVKNKPIAQYETINDRVKYKQTIFDDQLKLAFESQATFGDFVASQLSALYESDALDKYIKWKKYMSNANIYGTTATVGTDAADNADYGEALIKSIKDYVTKFRQPNTIFNANGDMAISSSIDVIMRATDKNLIDMDVLAGVYNVDKMSIDANFIYIDDFATVTDGSGSKTLACIIADSRAFSYTPRTPMGGSLYNPEDMYINYFLNIQGVYSVAKFRNVVGIYDGRTA